MLKAVFTGVALFVMLSGGISFAASNLKVNDIDSVLISSSKGSAYKEPEPLEEEHKKRRVPPPGGGGAPPSNAGKKATPAPTGLQEVKDLVFQNGVTPQEDPIQDELNKKNKKNRR